jgi:hypothetical protein
LVPGCYPGDGHHPGPAAAVEPAPPLPPRWSGDPADERARPEEPPRDQDSQRPGRQQDQAEPSGIQPGQGQHRCDRGGQRMPDDQPGQPAQQPGQLDQEDEPGRSLVDRCPPDRQGEWVPVVQLGHLLAGHYLAHSLVTSFVHAGENPGAAGGTSSSRPAWSIWAAITPPARPRRRLPTCSWRRISPARLGTRLRLRLAAGPWSGRRRSPGPGRAR